MIEATDITYRYRSGGGIFDVCLSARPATITVLVGPNGSGKSTLLRALAGVVSPQSGRVTVAGDDVARMNRAERARRIAFLPQMHVVPTLVRVRELVARGRQPHHRSGWILHTDDHEQIDAALVAVGMQDLVHRTLDELSGGELQRAWIAMALAQDTDILLLDEPLTHLDLHYRWGLLETLARIRDEQKKTMVVVMHELGPAAALADQVVALKEGRVAAAGYASAVLEEEMLHDVFGVRVDVHHRTRGERRPSITVYS